MAEPCCAVLCWVRAAALLLDIHHSFIWHLQNELSHTKWGLGGKFKAFWVAQVANFGSECSLLIVLFCFRVLLQQERGSGSISSCRTQQAPLCCCTACVRSSVSVCTPYRCYCICVSKDIPLYFHGYISSPLCWDWHELPLTARCCFHFWGSLSIKCTQSQTQAKPISSPSLLGF